MKEIYDEVVVNGNESSFFITSGEWIYMFTQAIYEEKRLIYVTDYNENLGKGLERKNVFTLFAIVNEEKMVVMNDNLFFFRNGYESVPNVATLGEFIQGIEKDANGVDIPLYAEEIEADTNTLSDSEKRDCEKAARAHLLGDKGTYIYPVFKLSEDDSFDLLLGKTSVEKLEDDFFKDKKYALEYICAREVYTKNLIESGGVTVEDWEMRLVDALRESDAKTVNTTFTKEGKTWT